MATVLQFEDHDLDLDALYARMWEIGIDDLGDGTRLYRPRPGGREALKWLVEELSGAVADPVRTTRANNALRQQVHRALVEQGRAERINQVSFRLLLPPAADAGAPREDVAGSAATEGLAVVGVAVSDVSSGGAEPDVAGLSWSPWVSLARAAQEATTRPGVYLARGQGQVLYVGMAGERRGSGVRGRLRVYARGRGAVSGLGEAALDRALADPAWLAVRLASLISDGPQRTQEWAVAAIDRAQLEVTWAEAPDESTAREWETRVLQHLEDVALWNRARPRSRGSEG